MVAIWKSASRGPRDGEAILASECSTLTSMLLGDEVKDELQDETKEEDEAQPANLGLLFSTGDVGQAARSVCVLLAGGGGTCLRPIFTQHLLPRLVIKLQSNPLSDCSRLEQV